MKFTLTPAKSINLSDLNKEQIVELCKFDPEWVFESAPHLLYTHRPDWCRKFKPHWTFDNYTTEMVSMYPAWCSYMHPDKMASLDWEGLLKYNPMWAIAHQLERVLRSHPDLVKYYSENYHTNATSKLKATKSWSDSWKLWSSKNQAGENLTIPKHIAKAINPNPKDTEEPKINEVKHADVKISDLQFTNQNTQANFA